MWFWQRCYRPMRTNWSDGNHWNNSNFNKNYSGHGRGDWNEFGNGAFGQNGQNGLFGQNGAFNGNKLNGYIILF